MFRIPSPQRPLRSATVVPMPTTQHHKRPRASIMKQRLIDGDCIAKLYVTVDTGPLPHQPRGEREYYAVGRLQLVQSENLTGYQDVELFHEVLRITSVSDEYPQDDDIEIASDFVRGVCAHLGAMLLSEPNRETLAVTKRFIENMHSLVRNRKAVG